MLRTCFGPPNFSARSGVAMPMNWKVKSPDPTIAQDLATKLSVPRLLGQLLVNRGISDEESARRFLSPRLSNMADPDLIGGMEEAVEAVCGAIRNQQHITIYGDYDADGLTGSALLYHFFRRIGVAATIYIPNRLEEGYGLNEDAIRKIASIHKGMLITVDCGISNMEEVALAKGLGLDVVVTDHHKIPVGYKFLCPTVNPHRDDSGYPQVALAGVGVAFLMAVALRSRLREKGFFRNKPVPDLKDMLDLVAIGTVADQVPLIGQNRVFVRYGLALLKDSKWDGLRTLIKASCVDPQSIDTQDIAFKIGPRLNAPGRVSSPDICVRLLTGADPRENERLTTEINRANALRQRLEQEVLGRISQEIEKGDDETAENVLIFGKEGWPEGVLGIVASKLVNCYRRPALVFTFKDELGKGSGRSIEQFDLYEAINRARDLFVRFGGHSQAAGFTIRRENFRKVKRALRDIAADTLGGRDLRALLEIDAELRFSEISRTLVELLDSLGPFGNGNPEPLFCTRSAQVLEARVVGNGHLKMMLRQDGKIYDAIGFSLGSRKPEVGSYIDVAYRPQINKWQGYETIQLRLIDIKQETG